MPQTDQLQGGCHCGAVVFDLQTAPQSGGFCHCNNCKKFSGSAHIPWTSFMRADFKLEGETRVYAHKGDSGHTIKRHFCPTCAVTVFVENECAPDMVFIPAGALSDMEAFVPQMSVYVSRAPSWAHVDHDHPTFPEMAPIPGS